MEKITVEKIRARKKKRKISVLTCYDYSFARIIDQAGIDIILVGDSLANVVLGLKETRAVPISEMYAHTRAVAKAVKKALVVADMPYAAYQKYPKRAYQHAAKFLDCGADAVKIEWFKDCHKVLKVLAKKGIPVMGHIGLTPQTVHLLGGYKVQGRDRQRAEELLEQARIFQLSGAFSIVIELIPELLAKNISRQIKIPTIGIGAGKYCDGQVLVLYDFLGLYSERKLKFVRIYHDLSKKLASAVKNYIKDVAQARFPSSKESFY
ncbi:MAG: 3-methyl-2-oxobutanoate hydroxymethyltransferase [Candidatus Omnitrophica bacterium]|nr:3-methyl-2-oxobutanoate hydroxymethyltransferase [Candidatus Omnitrophota bacterium]